MTTTVKKIEVSKTGALAKALDCDLAEAATAIDDGDYLVLDDYEATNACREYIEESLWAFNYSFLAGHSKAIAAIPEKDFQAMQGKLCESFNEAVKAMVDDFDYFVEDAINTDGRGRFLAGYDGEELELDGDFYAYRIN
mgnify:CR=1 FL=1|tara:strand:- start:528 stop:944 length:417 start_codon:yes stop_codon:yes gene_type:complete